MEDADTESSPSPDRRALSPGMSMRRLDRRHFTIGCLSAFAAAPSAILAAPAETAAPEPGSLDILVPTLGGTGLGLVGTALVDCLGQDGIHARLHVTPGGEAGDAVARLIAAQIDHSATVLIASSAIIGMLLYQNATPSLSAARPLVRLLNDYGVVVVSRDSAVASFGELAAAWVAAPASVRWTGAKLGSTSHILAVSIGRQLNLPAGSVLYRPCITNAAGLKDVLAGDAECGVANLSDLVPYLGSGLLRPLAVAAPQRLPGLNVPTLFEYGVDCRMPNWCGLFAPPGIGPAAYEALLAAMDRMASGLAWRSKLYQYNWISAYLGGEPYAVFVRAETERLRNLLATLAL